MSDLIEERQRIIKELNQAKLKFKQRGREFAQAERDYRVAKAKLIVTLRSENIPVTIIADLAKGDEQVAELKFIRDCAEVMYKSLVEAINILKLELRVNETDMDYERKGM